MTMQGMSIMDDKNVGVARLRANRRRYGRVMGGLMLAGGVIGAVVGLALATNHFSVGGERMQVVALLAVPALVIAVLVGSWKYFTTVDELEVDANKWAGLIAINFYALLWASWWAFAAVGLTGAPDGNVAFLLTMLIATITFLWRRFR